MVVTRHSFLLGLMDSHSTYFLRVKLSSTHEVHVNHLSHCVLCVWHDMLGQADTRQGQGLDAGGAGPLDTVACVLIFLW